MCPLAWQLWTLYKDVLDAGKMVGSVLIPQAYWLTLTGLMKRKVWVGLVLHVLWAGVRKSFNVPRVTLSGSHKTNSSIFGRPRFFCPVLAEHRKELWWNCDVGCAGEMSHFSARQKMWQLLMSVVSQPTSELIPLVGTLASKMLGKGCQWVLDFSLSWIPPCHLSSFFPWLQLLPP